MTLTIELTPEEASRLEFARRHGIDIEALVHGLLSGLPAPVSTPTATLFRLWEDSEATSDPQERARRQVEEDALLKALATSEITLPAPELGECV